MIGAGAIGSHLADCLSREGRFSWTIVDDDQLLPHNLARHVASGKSLMQSKAKVLAQHINDTLPTRAISINANLLDQASDAPTRALDAAELIIEATASLVAARYLSDHPATARRVSAFFNPAGNAADTARS